MIDYYETWFCEECGRSVVSNCGNPLYVVGKGIDTSEVCQECAEQYEEEVDDDAA